jgi:hypothetical protein
MVHLSQVCSLEAVVEIIKQCISCINVLLEEEGVRKKTKKQTIYLKDKNALSRDGQTGQCDGIGLHGARHEADVLSIRERNDRRRRHGPVVRRLLGCSRRRGSVSYFP